MPLLRPWTWIPAKLAHDLAPLGLEIASWGQPLDPPACRPMAFRGLCFPNPVGIAGGVDKNGQSIEAWWRLGAGFVEVGTVTPKPQFANTGTILDRDLRLEALWNRMGFPNDGCGALRSNLLDLPAVRPSPVFVNIGKNRDTPLTDAAADYIFCLEQMIDLADALVVNVSSPNTSGLRQLLSPDALAPLLRELNAARLASRSPHRPLLLKLSPDLEPAQLVEVVGAALEEDIDGFIATNTTLQRTPDMKFPIEGGVSGRPLAHLATATLKGILQSIPPQVRSRKLVVSTGGILSADDIQERLAIGADLVQVYSALALLGPWCLRRWTDELQS